MLIQYDHETVTHPAWQSFDRFQPEFFLEISYMFPGFSLKRKEDLREKNNFVKPMMGSSLKIKEDLMEQNNFVKPMMDQGVEEDPGILENMKKRLIPALVTGHTTVDSVTT